MITKFVVLIVALFVNIGLCTTWNDPNLDNWEEGWTVNIYGEPIDCDGKPCVRHKLTKPSLDSIDLSAKSCSKPDSDGLFGCNYLPENATVVDTVAELYDDDEKKNRTRHKRSQWIFDTSTGAAELAVWERTSFTYSVSADPSIASGISKAADYIQSAFNLWSLSCSDYSAFVSQWKYTPSVSSANVWFDIRTGTICEKPLALACAFFPYQYPARTTIYINNARIVTKSRSEVIRTMAHEIGHMFGLAHEEESPGSTVWSPFSYDDASIMRPSLGYLSTISQTDCAAMKFYSEGFPQPERCRATRVGYRCTKAPIHYVSPINTKISSGSSFTGGKDGHDELLEDADETTCTGGDITKYIMNNPYDAATHSQGYFNRGTALSQCEAVIVNSKSFFAMQSDGNFVSYNKATGDPIWTTGTNGKGEGGYSIIFQEDGNLVIYDYKEAVIWASGTNFNATYWAFQDDGTTCVADASKMCIWGRLGTN